VRLILKDPVYADVPTEVAEALREVLVFPSGVTPPDKAAYAADEWSPAWRGPPTNRCSLPAPQPVEFLVAAASRHQPIIQRNGGDLTHPANLVPLNARLRLPKAHSLHA